MADVLSEVRAERIRQDERWGWTNRDPAWHVAVLMEEVGELARALHDLRFASGGRVARDSAREEAIQIAAVAVAFVEGLDGGRWLGLEVGE
uniref:NTP pyrophosphohydrolase MazG putative catalytic core domain-containing protein n=1 Tax=viral metagenome TaxID=1070528 RepID=A0A6M3JNZ7_9ZZZZ